MNRPLLKQIDKIKNYLRDLDEEGIVHPIVDKIYDHLTEMEDIIYENDDNQSEDESEMFYE